MLRIYRTIALLSLPFFWSITATDEADQQYVDSLVHDLFSKPSFTYTPLQGGILAQVSRVTVEPSTCVVRRINADNSFERCVQEAVIAQMCGAQGIGPKVYVPDPAHKLILLEYLPKQATSRAQCGDPTFLRDLGSLIARFHALDTTQIEADAQNTFGCQLSVSQCYTFSPDTVIYRIEQAEALLQRMGLTVAEVTRWVTDCDKKLEELYLKNGSRRVLSHGDLHPGNVLYTGDRSWLIDYEMSGFASWFYDLGVLAVFFCVTEESDTYLLEGYFGVSADQIKADDWVQYQCMKCMAWLFYTLRWLARHSDELIDQAIATNADLMTLYEALKNGTLTIDSGYAEVQFAIAMIRHVGEIHKKIMAS